MTSAIAAIDLGTHSARLLIERDRQTLVRRVELTRLGEAMGTSRTITDAALERSATALRAFRSDIDAHDVGTTSIVATSAARDATNGQVFVDMVEHILGTPPTVLSGDDEAALAFAGATAELDTGDGPFLVVDIGGGSTEFAFGTGSCEGQISLDMGSVRLTNKYIESDPPRPEELSACITVADAWLDDLNRELPQALTARTVIGVGGTISTAAAVELGIDEYDRDRLHHFVLERAAAEDVFRTLATESRQDRAWNPGLPAARVDTIVGGMAILVKTMRHLELDSLLVSESDLLDGLALTLR